MTFRPAERDREILSFDEPRFAQPLTERCDHGGGLSRRSAAEKANHGHCRLLRTRRERPCGYTAAEQRDELAPSHVGHGPSSRPGMDHQQSTDPSVGLPHAQPAAERPASPWGRPESF